MSKYVSMDEWQTGPYVQVSMMRSMSIYGDGWQMACQFIGDDNNLGMVQLSRLGGTLFQG